MTTGLSRISCSIAFSTSSMVRCSSRRLGAERKRVHLPHEIPERVVHQTVLIDEGHPGKGGGPHSHVEMIAFPGGVDDHDRGPGQRVRETALQLVDTHHRAWLSPARTWSKSAA